MTPLIQFSSRGGLNAPVMNTRTMWATTITIIPLAAQWWIARIPAPKRTSFSMNWMLAYASSGVGL